MRQLGSYLMVILTLALLAPFFPSTSSTSFVHDGELKKGCSVVYSQNGREMTLEFLGFTQKGFAALKATEGGVVTEVDVTSHAPVYNWHGYRILAFVGRVYVFRSINGQKSNIKCE